MKILVLSDVHGLVSYAERMVEREQPDEVIFLGDGLRDIEQSARFFPKVRFHFVKGNCDFAGEKEEQCITLGGKSIYFTHGHRYNVKMERALNYITLRAHAAQLGADIALFGHTHQPDLVFMSGICMMNPGAVMAGKYGVIDLAAGEIKPELKSL